jgi:hypothetical protein
VYISMHFGLDLSRAGLNEYIMFAVIVLCVRFDLHVDVFTYA